MAENADKKSKIPWAILNDVRGSLDIELDKIGEWIAEKVPEDSFLRKEASARIFGILKQHVERKASTMGPAANFFIEGLVDIGDYLTGALHGDKKTEAEGKSGKKSVSNKSIESARAAFIAKITTRLETAANPEEEAEKIKKELQLFDEIIFGKKEEPVAKVDKPKGKSFWESFNEADRNAASHIRDFRTEFFSNRKKGV